VAVAFIALIEGSKRKPVDWRPSFSSKHKRPWGTYVLRREFARYFPGREIENIYISPYEKLESGPQAVQTTYCFVNNFMALDKESQGKLLDFAHSGNKVFISSGHFPVMLLDSLRVSVDKETNYNFVRDSTPKAVYLTNPALTDTAYFAKSFRRYYFSSFISDSTLVLGMHRFAGKEYVDFIRVRYGEGYFFLHTQPYVFTNYHMLKPGREGYVAAVMSYLDNGRIWWDMQMKSDPGEVRHPLRFILGNPPLAWAWKLGIWGLATFVLFTAKRKQRAIPVIPPVKNTSVEFARTIGEMYRRQGTPGDIIRLQIRFFYHGIRRKHLMDPMQRTPGFIRKLNIKTGVPTDELERLFRYIDYLTAKNEYSEENLLTLNKLLNNYYKKSY